MAIRVLVADDQEPVRDAVRGLHEGRGLIDPKVTGRLIARFAQLSRGSRRAGWTSSRPASTRCRPTSCAG